MQSHIFEIILKIGRWLHPWSKIINIFSSVINNSKYLAKSFYTYTFPSLHLFTGSILFHSVPFLFISVGKKYVTAFRQNGMQSLFWHLPYVYSTYKHTNTHTHMYIHTHTHTHTNSPANFRYNQEIEILALGLKGVGSFLSVFPSSGLPVKEIPWVVIRIAAGKGIGAP